MGIHEKYLGKKVGESIERSPLNLENANPHFLTKLKSSEANIYMTFNGLVGDSGSTSPLQVIFCSEKERERILLSQDSYRLAFQSRERCKAADQVNIQGADSCMTTFFGLDNRNLLPPFFPNFRMEDALFGQMLAKCNADSCFANLPWTLLHIPIEKRQFSSIQIEIEDSFWPFDAVRAAMRNFQTGTKMPFEKALRRVGEELINFGMLPFEDYREILARDVNASRALRVMEHEDLLKRYPQSPAYWKKDVKTILQQLKQATLNEMIFAPIHMVEEFGQHEAEKMVQALVYKFGKLVSTWSDIVQVSKELRKKGIRITKNF